MEAPLLTVMIPVHPKHIGYLQPMLDTLYAQIGRLDDISSVEVLHSVRGDITTGENRNLLLSLAKGVNVVSIDCDDSIADCYIEAIVDACKLGADTVAINGTYTCDGKDLTQWFLSKNNPNSTVRQNGKKVFLRTTNHLSPVKRALALKAGYPAISNGEDKAYSDALNPFLKTEVTINEPLYWYNFKSQGKTYR